MATTFPLIFGREGGTETNILDCLVMERGDVECNNITTLKMESEALKQEIVNLLFDLIGIESSHTRRNTLLSLKRDIFNNRNLEKYSDILAGHGTLKTVVDLYISCSVQIAMKEKQFKVSFDKYLRKGVDTIRDSWGQHFLANGILFSSGVLYEQILKIAPKDFKISSSNKNLILTITKYFIRSVTKTTPFSSFNRVFVMELKENTYKNIDFNQQESRMQISNLIFFRIKEILLGNKNFISHLTVHLNSTINKDLEDDDYFHFFVNIKNNEYFKKAKKNAVVLALIKYAEKPVSFQDLEDLIAIKFAQSKETTSEFLNALIDAGILILQFPAGMDNIEWVSRLIAFIDSKKLNFDLEVLNVYDCLQILRSTVLSLESTRNISQRNQYLDQSSRLIGNALNFDGKCEYINGLVRSKILFYENVFTKSEIEFESSHIEEVQNRVRKVFFAINNIRVKNRRINFLYRSMKQKGVEKMPLLQAYEEIYLKNKKAIDSESENLDAANVMLNKLLSALMIGEVDCPIDIRCFIEPESVTVDNDIKFGAFVQFIDDKADDVVINSFSGGFGSNISRYLGFCPSNVLARCREYVLSCESNYTVADIRDASIHNSSSFPNLANYTIDIASADTQSNEPISLNALYLEMCGENGLRITNNQGVVIKPVNFSMEAINRKSKFTQFLDLFNNTDTFGYIFFMQRVSESLINSALNCNVRSSPRILFDKKVILKRKQWHIKLDYLLSYIGVDERPEVLFVKINSFLREYSIPSAVFVKFSHTRKSNGGGSNDDYKPCYVDFMAPLSVLLFMNMVSKSDNVIELSEVLPAFPSADEGSPGRVSEYVMNF